MNVLSLFDGISCGKVALDREQFNVENYYASEVCDYSIAISKKIIQQLNILEMLEM